MRRLVLLLSALALALAYAPAASAATEPNDALWGQQWGPQQVRAPEAWSTSTGAGQVIAIVDSGVDLSHPDLVGKFVPGATFVGCAENGPCGNGDWESGGQAAGEPDPHGTHVAGIAAAVTNNSQGIAGVAPDASLMPVKVLGEEGGTFAEIGAGIRWAADHGADVINMSLGALPGVQALEITGIESDAREAIEYANSKGVVVVAAAGNEFASICASPSFSDGALCVAATDRNEVRANYSNFAIKPDLLTVSAPGGQGALFCEEDIISTVPVGHEDYCPGNAGYDYYAGTSMATPHVSGVAALLTAQGRTNTAVYDVLTSTARKPQSDVRGVYDPVYGYGIVDAAAAVASPGATTGTTTSGGTDGGSTDGGSTTKGGKGSGKGNSRKG
jgi:subtilisin family serine protease